MRGDASKFKNNPYIVPFWGTSRPVVSAIRPCLTVQLGQLARDLYVFMAQKSETITRHSRRYPATHTSPWFFVLLAAVTITLIVSGVFHINPITKILHFLAVVL